MPYLADNTATNPQQAVRSGDCFRTVGAHQNRSATSGRLLDQLTQTAVRRLSTFERQKVWIITVPP